MDKAVQLRKLMIHNLLVNEVVRTKASCHQSRKSSFSLLSIQYLVTRSLDFAAKMLVSQELFLHDSSSPKASLNEALWCSRVLFATLHSRPTPRLCSLIC